MIEEKKSKEPKLTIRETTIIQYEVVDEDGNLMSDEQGDNLFDTREEAERVLGYTQENDDE